MRISCPHCRRKFDLAHTAVIAEVRKLTQLRKDGKVTAAHDDIDGNRLDPADAKAIEQRQEAIRRRAR